MAQLAMFVYTAVYLGRVHELFAVLAPFRVVFALALISGVLTLALPRRKRNPVFAQREVRIVLALAALAVAFTPFSVWSGGSWTFLADNFGRVLIFFLLVVALARSRRSIHVLLWAVLTGMASLGISTIAWGALVMTEYGGRAYASRTYDPNDVAMMMVCALPLAAAAALALRGARRIAAVAVALVCVVAIIMTMSRGGFIGLIVVALLLLMRLGTAKLVPRVVVLVAIVAVLVAVAPARYWDMMSTIWAPSAGGEYVERGVWSRIDLWMHGLRLFAVNPLTGAGIGMYEVAEGLSHGGRGKWSAAHNSFLQVGTELGIAGITLFSAVIVLSLVNLRRTVRLARRDAACHDLAWIAAAVETSLYAYVLEGFALSQAYSAMLYFLIGVATALRLEVERRRRPATAVPAAASPAAQAPRPVPAVRVRPRVLPRVTTAP